MIQIFNSLFGSGGQGTSKFISTNNTRNVLVQGTGAPTYELDNAFTVNARLLRQLYYNRNNNYALAGQLAKPIIRVNVTFISRPRLTSTDEVTDDFLKTLILPTSDVHKLSEREGACFVWPQWSPELNTVIFTVMPYEQLQKRIIDPISKKVLGYVFEEQVQYNDINGLSSTANIIVQVTADQIITRSDVPGSTMSVVDNVFKFIPIVQFNNDLEVYEDRGHSELENVEPYLKFYHDTTMEAAQAQKNDGHPKMQLMGTDEPKTWVDNNFGTGTFDGILTGKTKIKLDDRDFYINKGTEKVEYINRGQVTGDYAVISERGFTNIVEGSETPEVMFGANLGTSLASVKEQRPVWIRKIKEKQSMYSKQWQIALEMARAIYTFATLQRITGVIEQIWPEPDFKDEKEGIEIVKIASENVIKLKNAFLM